MRRLLADGFGIDLIIFALVAILLGGAAAGGVGWLAQRGLDRAVSGLIGDYGRYDAIIQVHQESATAAKSVIRGILAQQLPGARLADSIALSGERNLLLGIPAALKTPERLSRLDEMFRNVPGYAGISMIIEPSVVVKGVMPAADPILVPKIEAVPGVRFTFRSGNDLLAVLRSADDVRPATDAIDRIVHQWKLVELRTPLGVDLSDPGGTAERIVESAGAGAGLHNVTQAARGQETASFVSMLREMRRFLISYATTIEIPANGAQGLAAGDRLVLQGAAKSAPRPGEKAPKGAAIVQLWSREGGLAKGIVTGGERGEAPKGVSVDGWRVQAWLLGPDGIVGAPVGSARLHNARVELNDTLLRGETLLQQLHDLNQKTGDVAAQATKTAAAFTKLGEQLGAVQGRLGLNAPVNAQSEALFSMLLGALLHQNAPGAAGGLDLSGLQKRLDALQAAVRQIDTLDIDAMTRQIEGVRRSLPDLSDVQIADSINLIDSYLAGQVIPGDRLSLLAPAGYDIDAHLAQFRAIAGNAQLSAFSMAPGVVTPDARSAVFGVLAHVRELVAALTAALLTTLVLAFDWSGVIAFVHYRRRKRRRSLVWAPAGAVAGAALLTGMAALAGALHTSAALAAVAGGGALLGAAMGALAERINPIDTDEVLAGQALGLGDAQLMRQIVLPAGRPGVLSGLNRLRQWFA
ncbi:MAG TPA: hypothetical protein VFK80_09880 [Limnochordia bacterium]|nr:hypothetical protein [Limnochordia bacterium]